MQFQELPEGQPAWVQSASDMNFWSPFSSLSNEETRKLNQLEKTFTLDVSQNTDQKFLSLNSFQICSSFSKPLSNSLKFNSNEKERFVTEFLEY